MKFSRFRALTSKFERAHEKTPWKELSTDGSRKYRSFRISFRTKNICALTFKRAGPIAKAPAREVLKAIERPVELDLSSSNRPLTHDTPDPLLLSGRKTERPALRRLLFEWTKRRVERWHVSLIDRRGCPRETTQQKYFLVNRFR